MTNLQGTKPFIQAPGPHLPPSQPEDDAINLGALFTTLWRGKWIIAAITCLAILLGGYYAYVAATPLYRSTTVVILDTQQENIVDLQSVVGGLSGETSEVNSEVEVLRARGLMGQVVDRLELTEDPEFNSVLRPVGTLDQITGAIRGALGLISDAAPLPPEEAERRTRDSVVSSLLDQVSVRNKPLSLVFEITAETESPEKSALIADTIAELYIRSQIQVKFDAMEQATGWLTGRVAELEAQLEEAELAVSDFSASTDLVSAAALQALERQLKEMRERIDMSQEAQIAAADRLMAMQLATTRDEKSAAADDGQLRRYLLRAESDPAMARAFDARFTQLLSRAELDVTRAEQQVAALQGSEQELTLQIRLQGDDLIELQQLTREAEAIRLLYEYFLTRLNETAAQQGIQQADSRILSNAVVPNGPSQPRKSLILAMSGILGLTIGMGLILLREARSNGFRTVQDLEAFTGYTVLGQIPQIPARNRKRALSYLSERPTSAAAEAVRNLRTSVLLSNVDSPPKVIVSTSSIPGEGKTTNSLALTQNLLGLGKSVLLIEGDIRRRTFSQYFDDLPKRGLVSVLGGEITLSDAVYRPADFAADILVGEKSTTNAADLFASDRFGNLMADMRTRYDAIIIDTPPVLVVPDARIIAQQADAVLFTVQWDKTSKAQIEEALRMFHSSGQRITGLVLSQISPKGMKRYGHGNLYGAYAGYGADYYAN